MIKLTPNKEQRTKNKEQRTILLLLFLIISNMATAQWTQLGPGAGGQERAVFLYNNPNTGLEDLYVGSDVSGVWRAPNINAADISNPLQYDYTYISNNELFRFVNKFVNQPAYPNILFVGNRGGIDIVDMANTNASVQKLWDMPDAWVSDIHVIETTPGGSHTIFATTGSTRIQDEPNNNKNNTTIADLYEFTWNGATTAVTTTGYQLDGLSGDQDVYCMFVDESPVDDIFLLGTQTGLFQFPKSQITGSTISGAQIAGPNSVGTNYKVTSITREGTSDLYLVTLYDQGLWEYNALNKTWSSTNFITHLIGEDENSSNTVTTKDYANDNASYSFTRLLQMNGTNPGWVLLNEEQTYDNHYVGVFYSEDNGSGVPTGNWRVLNTYTGSNDWGWNNAKPCGNINSALITSDNKLLIGKSGNIFITQNPITNITPLNVAWQQIYSRNGVGNNGTCADSYKNMGYVNYAAKAVYHDAAGVTCIAQADRLMFYSNQNTDFYQPIDKATNSSCSNVDLSGNFSYPNCVGTLDKNLPLSDCFFITDDQSGDIWAGMGSGFASKKGYGFVVKRNNLNDWKREGDAICGDPQKIFFAGTDKYLLVNEPSGGGARIHKLNGASWGPPMQFWNGNNEELQDAVVGVNDNMLYVIRKTNPKFEIVRIDLTGPSLKTTNTLLNTDQVPLRLAIMPYNTNDYKIIVGCGPKNSTSNTNLENLKETYIYTNSSTTYTYNAIDIMPANLSNIFQDLHFDALDNTDHGITGICIDKDLGTIYVSTVKMKSGPLAERSHIYRGTYNTSNGNIDINWTEITGQLPNKAIKFMTCKGNTICNEQIYCCVRGLGAWRWNASAVTFTGVTNISCPGNTNGQATAVPPAIWSGNNTYTWSNGATTAGVANLAAGTYTVIVTNINSGCSSSGSLTITTPVLTIAAPAAVCYLAQNGTATAILTPVTPGLNYSWSNSQTTASVTGLGASTYTVIVNSFGGGCVTSLTASVTIATSSPMLNLAVSQPACSGTTGIIKCTATGYAPFQFKWVNQATNSGPYQTSGLFNNLSNGTYVVTVSDLYGCTVSGTKSLNNAQQLAPTYNNGLTIAISAPTRWDLGVTTISNNTTLNLTALNLFCLNSSSSIIVNSGCTLNITNCNISACGDMWQGIINNGGTVILDNSIIEDAENGLFSSINGSIFEIENSTFNSNYIDINLNGGDYANSFFKNNNFTCTNTLKAPHESLHTEMNFYLEGVSAISIGDATNFNDFSGSNFGIYATSSSFEANNNHFTDIGYFGAEVEQYYAGIKAVGEGVATIGNLSVNTFTDCYGGVITNDNIITTVKANEFTNCPSAIALLNNNYSDIIVVENTIEGCNEGIIVYDIQHNEVCSISSNRFTGTRDQGTPINNIGIAVYKFIKNRGPLEISNNIIDDYIESIWVIGIKGGADGIPLIYRNNINYNFDETQIGLNTYLGITAQGCDQIKIEENNINWINGPADPFDYGAGDVITKPKLYGIRIEETSNSTIRNNNFYRNGTGIHLNYNNFGNILTCNTMEDCFPSIFLNSVFSLPSQGSPLSSNENVWLGDFSISNHFKVDGINTNLIVWYFNGNQGNTNIHCPVPYNNNTVFPVTINIPNPINPCNDIEPPDELRASDSVAVDQLLSKIVADSIEYPINEEANKYTSLELAYKIMKLDSSLITSLEKEQFMQQTETENIGLLDAVADSLASGDIASAFVINNTVIDTNIIENNKITINDILINSYDDSIYKFDLNDSVGLLNVASQPLASGGEAVLRARAVLQKRTIDEIGINNARLTNKTKSKFESNDINIYPVPTSKYLNIVCKVKQIQSLILLDVTGKIILSQENINAYDNTLSIKTLSEGIYTLQVKIENNEMFCYKVVIIQ